LSRSFQQIYVYCGNTLITTVCVVCVHSANLILIVRMNTEKWILQSLTSNESQNASSDILKILCNVEFVIDPTYYIIYVHKYNNGIHRYLFFIPDYKTLKCNELFRLALPHSILSARQAHNTVNPIPNFAPKVQFYCKFGPLVHPRWKIGLKMVNNEGSPSRLQDILPQTSIRFDLHQLQAITVKGHKKMMKHIKSKKNGCNTCNALDTKLKICSKCVNLKCKRCCKVKEYFCSKKCWKIWWNLKRHICCKLLV